MTVPSSLPARKSSGRTEAKMSSTTRDDFSSVTRLPTWAANVITVNMTTISAKKVVSRRVNSCSVSSPSMSLMSTGTTLICGEAAS